MYVLFECWYISLSAIADSKSEKKYENWGQEASEEVRKAVESERDIIQLICGHKGPRGFLKQKLP